MIGFLFAQVCYSSAFIVFDKKVVEMEGKVGENVNVVYNILNLGDSSAQDLFIEDSGIPRDQWTFNNDVSELRWGQIGAGENVTHVFQVQPRVSGNLRMGSSKLVYHESGVKKICLSSSTFWFESKVSRSIGAKSNLVGYSIFIFASFLMIFVPFLIWYMGKGKSSEETKVKKH